MIKFALLFLQLLPSGDVGGQLEAATTKIAKYQPGILYCPARHFVPRIKQACVHYVLYSSTNVVAMVKEVSFGKDHDN